MENNKNRKAFICFNAAAGFSSKWGQFSSQLRLSFCNWPNKSFSPLLKTGHPYNDHSFEQVWNIIWVKERRICYGQQERQAPIKAHRCFSLKKWRKTLLMQSSNQSGFHAPCDVLENLTMYFHEQQKLKELFSNKNVYRGKIYVFLFIYRHSLCT